MPEEWLTIRDVATRTRLSERTVRELISRGQLPVSRPAGVRVVRITPEAVVALMEDSGLAAEAKAHTGDRRSDNH